MGGSSAVFVFKRQKCDDNRNSAAVASFGILQMEVGARLTGSFRGKPRHDRRSSIVSFCRIPVWLCLRSLARSPFRCLVAIVAVVCCLRVCCHRRCSRRGRGLGCDCLEVTLVHGAPMASTHGIVIYVCLGLHSNYWGRSEPVYSLWFRSWGQQCPAVSTQQCLPVIT